MTVKEAVLKSLEDLKGLSTHLEVYDHLTKSGYYTFTTNKTPANYVSAVLGSFIRKKDKRVKRIYERSMNRYKYYLTKFEDQLDLGDIDTIELNNTEKKKESGKYKERDIHLLLSSYLKNDSIYSKTIFHEKSNGSDKNKKWVHPDMVGVKLLKLRSSSSQKLLKVTNKNDLFKLYSYELKREINSDYDLKKYFFQAVSNSSWANYGFLVAYDISSSLHEEIERLSQSFGIGVIEIKSELFESEILFPAKYRPIDFKTLDKLCKINPDFDSFIGNVEKLLSVEDRYASSVEREFEEVCDDYLVTDTEIRAYMEKMNFPLPEEDNGEVG